MDSGGVRVLVGVWPRGRPEQLTQALEHREGAAASGRRRWHRTVLLRASTRTAADARVARDHLTAPRRDLGQSRGALGTNIERDALGRAVPAAAEAMAATAVVERSVRSMATGTAWVTLADGVLSRGERWVECFLEASGYDPAVTSEKLAAYIRLLHETGLVSDHDAPELLGP